ncbi:MAG: FMN-binding protein [Bacteroidales bacterium]|nr:FMN-binding protein [Bacteroidales bacterium]
MKKTILILGILAVLGGTCYTSTSCSTSARAKGTDTLKINTSEIAADVIGFNGATPMEISVVKGVITEIKPLPNQETPQYFQLVLDSGLLDKLIGKAVEEADTVRLDAVSGATYSSTAVIRTVRRGLESLSSEKGRE